MEERCSEKADPTSLFCPRLQKAVREITHKSQQISSTLNFEYLDVYFFLLIYSECLL